jgi:hypothetical protein
MYFFNSELKLDYERFPTIFTVPVGGKNCFIREHLSLSNINLSVSCHRFIRCREIGGVENI